MRQKSPRFEVKAFQKNFFPELYNYRNYSHDSGKQVDGSKAFLANRRKKRHLALSRFHIWPQNQLFHIWPQGFLQLLDSDHLSGPLKYLSESLNKYHIL